VRHLLHHKVAVPQDSASVADLGGSYVALGQEVTAQAVGNLAGIDSVVLLLGCGDRSQHQRMCHLHLPGVRKQVIVDPAREDHRFHSHYPRLR